MPRVFIYVVARDFGFAPNPFHGTCTLATCKPGIRRSAVIGDWILGVGGARLGATGKCIFAMKVSEKLTFDEYWSDLRFRDKKPVRNGSQRMLVGDNIYHRNRQTKKWIQADSHHSLANGQVNLDNLTRDTSSEHVLISRHFIYFGLAAPAVPSKFYTAIGFKNGIGHRVYEESDCRGLLDWLENTYSHSFNTVAGDPFDFKKSEARYDTGKNKIS
jgi:hypothetical protein